MNSLIQQFAKILQTTPPQISQEDLTYVENDDGVTIEDQHRYTNIQIMINFAHQIMGYLFTIIKQLEQLPINITTSICIDESDEISWYSFNIYVAMGKTLIAYSPFANIITKDENSLSLAIPNEINQKLINQLPQQQQISFINLQKNMNFKLIATSFQYSKQFEDDIVSMKLFEGNLYISLNNGEVFHYTVKPILYGEEKHDLELSFVDSKKFDFNCPMLTLIQKNIFIIHDKKIIPYEGELVPTFTKFMIHKQLRDNLNSNAQAKIEFLKMKEEMLKKRREELEQKQSEIPDTQQLLQQFKDLNSKILQTNEDCMELNEIYQKLLSLEEEIKQGK